MTALSIRNMRFTLNEREQALWRLEDAACASQAPEPEPSCYWHIERRSKSRKDTWIFVRDFWATKAKAEEFYSQNYQNQQPEHRLVCKYNPESLHD